MRLPFLYIALRNCSNSVQEVFVMKEGILYYDEASDRMDIQFHSGGKYGGLHCGDCFDVWVDNKWTPTRIEMGREWYLVGVKTDHLPGLSVRM